MIGDIPKIKFEKSRNFFLIAGPCVVENETMIYKTGEKLKRLCEDLKIPFIFKASYKKANRTRLDSFTGIGDRQALEILNTAGEMLDVPVLTDVHQPEEARMAADYVEVLQIPAFLCRQTDLLLAAGKTGKTVNIKKGQFLAPASMHYAVEKVRSTGNNQVMLTERGTTFGYSDLIVDMRSIPEMQKSGTPVVLDITHSLQQPNQTEGVTGGRPDLIATIGRAGVAAGADGIFIETHPRPETALSDGANMLPLNQMKSLLKTLINIRQCICDSSSS